MRRYYIEDGELKDRAFLSPEDSHHAVRVLRLEVGDQLEVVSSKGQLYLAEILSTDEIVEVKAIKELQNESELPVQVTIACGISKQDKLEKIAQKGTECGMHAMIPLALQRDVSKWEGGKKQQKKVDRLQRIAEEASKQSKRLHIPKLESLHHLADLIDRCSEFDHMILADEELGHHNQHQALAQVLAKAQPGDKLLAVFGSEGGIDRQERQIMEEAGFVPCSLGPRILRCETAPIYFLSAVSYAFELSPAEKS